MKSAMTTINQDILALCEEFLDEISQWHTGSNTMDDLIEHPAIQFFSKITGTNLLQWVDQCDDGGWGYNLEQIHKLRDQAAELSLEKGEYYYQ